MATEECLKDIPKDKQIDSPVNLLASPQWNPSHIQIRRSSSLREAIYMMNAFRGYKLRDEEEAGNMGDSIIIILGEVEMSFFGLISIFKSIDYKSSFAI